MLLFSWITDLSKESFALAASPLRESRAWLLPAALDSARLRITHEPLIKTPVTSSVAAFLRLCCSCIFDHFLLEILSSHRLPLSALNPHAKPSPPTTECHPILISAWYTPPACLCFQTCSVRRLSFKPLSWKCSISFLSSCDSYLKYFWDAFFFFYWQHDSVHISYLPWQIESMGVRGEVTAAASSVSCIVGDLSICLMYCGRQNNDSPKRSRTSECVKSDGKGEFR